MNRSEGEKGFSLIESMVALLIISVALLAMGALTINVMRQDNTAKLRTIAMHIAEQQLESWYSQDTVGTAASGPSQTTVIPVSVGNGTVNFQLQSFDATPIGGVNSTSLGSSNGLASEVRSITVYWEDSGGEHHVTVTNLQRTMD